jgi:hypothetical protein
MEKNAILKVLTFLVTVLPAVPLWGASYYTVRLDDSKVVYPSGRYVVADIEGRARAIDAGDRR